MTTRENKHDEFDALRNIVEELKDFSKEDQNMIIKWACEKLLITTPGPITKTPDILSTDLEITTPSNMTKNIKSFVDEKNPQSDIHFAVVVAYFYRFLAGEKKEVISTVDLQEATRLSNRTRLSKPAKTMNNAATSGLLDNAGRGLYKINTVGENLVAMVLPGDFKNTPATKKRAVKKTAKKAAKKTGTKRK